MTMMPAFSFSNLLAIALVVATCLPSATALPMKTFGTSLSQQQMYAKDRLIFEYSLSDSAQWGVMTTFWCTGDNAIDTAIWSYYIDDDTTPSIQFSSALGAGAGFADVNGLEPWGNKWTLKAGHHAQTINFRIPFYSNIRIYARLDPTSIYNNTEATFWAIVRGTENLPTSFNGFELPTDRKARLYLQKIENTTLTPLQFINIVDIPQGEGMLLSHTLQGESKSINFLEGCYHAFSPYDTAWPGMIVSSGTEDFEDSCFYFNAGPYQFDLAGLTYFDTVNDTIKVSFYRNFDLDTIFFSDGFRFVWRNGDVFDGNGYKCILEEGGTPAGNPLNTTLTSYAWYYLWEPESSFQSVPAKW